MEEPESYKIFNFREQTLQMGENDAPGQGLQYALKTRHQTDFLRKLWAFQFSFRTSAEIKCIEFTTCTYNFKKFAVRSTIKTVENTLEKEGKKKKFARALFFSAY